MQTPEYASKPYTAEEIEVIRAADADHDWAGQATMRLNQAQQLLDDISEVVEDLPAPSREHAADLLDTAIETLTRVTRRFPPPEAEATAPSEDPPF